jgi:Uma2 family endonuclease
MGLPAEKPGRATYADLVAVPKRMVAEIVDGVLHVFPRPAPPHAYAASGLGMDVGGPFDRGRGGPGGWRILDEPELHFGPADDRDVLVPDLAGWRLERMPKLPSTAYFTLAPDWVCEVLSPSTEVFDRAEKMPIYAREGVRHAWLVHPVHRTLEVFRLGKDRLWHLLGVHRDSAIVRAEPFDAVELALSALWTDIDPAMMEEYERPTPHATLQMVKPKTPRRAPLKKARPRKA